MFILDGISYDVGVAAVSREAKLEERYRITTADGKIHREVQGVYFTYQLTLGNIAKAAYDNLYAAPGRVLFGAMAKRPRTPGYAKGPVRLGPFG